MWVYYECSMACSDQSMYQTVTATFVCFQCVVGQSLFFQDVQGVAEVPVSKATLRL
jgi:hypothetical protein